MITKDKAVEHLKASGYDAHLEDGIVWVRSADHGITKKVHQELKQIGYDQSFGFKFERGEG